MNSSPNVSSSTSVADNNDAAVVSSSSSDDDDVVQHPDLVSGMLTMSLNSTPQRPTPTPPAIASYNNNPSTKIYVRSQRLVLDNERIFCNATSQQGQLNEDRLRLYVCKQNICGPPSAVEIRALKYIQLTNTRNKKIYYSANTRQRDTLLGHTKCVYSFERKLTIHVDISTILHNNPNLGTVNPNDKNSLIVIKLEQSSVVDSDYNMFIYVGNYESGIRILDENERPLRDTEYASGGLTTTIPSGKMLDVPRMKHSIYVFDQQSFQ